MAALPIHRAVLNGGQNGIMKGRAIPRGLIIIQLPPKVATTYWHIITFTVYFRSLIN